MNVLKCKSTKGLKFKNGKKLNLIKLGANRTKRYLYFNWRTFENSY